MTRIMILAAGVAVSLPTAAAADAPFLPGEWQMTMNVTAFEMANPPPGLDPAMFRRPTTISHCFTAEQAAKSPEEIFRPGSACTFTHFSATGGRLDEALTCRQRTGTMTMTASGSYTPTSFTVTTKSAMTGTMAMTMAGTTTGTRVGACPAGSK